VRRRSVLLSALILAGVAAAVVGGLTLLVKQEPSFYASAPGAADDWDARDRSSRLVTRAQDLKNDIRSKTEWGDSFGADELNCFLHENLGEKGGLCSLLPANLHDPRVAVDGDRLRVGFRYGDGFWSTVVWVELRVWLVANETNVVAVELCDLKAGGLPIGSQTVLDSVTDAVRDSNVEVTWYRNRSNPVGLFKFYADQRQPVAQILTLDVKDGRITVAGRSFVDRAQTPPPGVIPVVPAPVGGG
jgi:hypothetical protein